MRQALELIRDARDVHADTGAYPPAPAGPNTAVQCFDDWAADVADAALKNAPTARELLAALRDLIFPGAGFHKRARLRKARTNARALLQRAGVEA